MRLFVCENKEKTRTKVCLFFHPDWDVKTATDLMKTKTDASLPLVLLAEPNMLQHYSITYSNWH